MRCLGPAGEPSRAASLNRVDSDRRTKENRPDRLCRVYSPLKKGQSSRGWVTDITYLWTLEGWLYLSVILDLFSRRVVGFALHPQPLVLTPQLYQFFALGALQPPAGPRPASANRRASRYINSCSPTTSAFGFVHVRNGRPAETPLTTVPI